MFPISRKMALILRFMSYSFLTQVGMHFSRKLRVNLLYHGLKNLASRLALLQISKKFCVSPLVLPAPHLHIPGVDKQHCSQVLCCLVYRVELLSIQVPVTHMRTNLEPWESQINCKDM